MNFLFSNMSIRRSVAVGFAAWALVAGCSSTPTDAPLSAMNDPKEKAGIRRASIESAMERAIDGGADKEAVRESLKRVVWGRGNWVELRLAAARELLSDEEGLADTRKMFRLLMQTEKMPQMIALIGDEAAARGWTDLSAALVRSWSRPLVETPDAERSERAALVRLYPGRAVEDVVFEVFTGAIDDGGKPLSDKQRQDAWSLLRRLDKDGERTLGLLAGSGGSSEDRLTGVLRRGARDLGVVPDTGDELAWLDRLSGRDYAAVWSEGAAAVARLTPDQKQGLRLRHVLAARWAAVHEPAWLAASRDELISQLRAAVDPRRQHLRGGALKSSGGRNESVIANADLLTWGDALMVMIAARAVESEAFARAVMAHAEEDKRDTSTELGGVIDAAGSGFVIRKFPPRPGQRYGDQRFVASPEMVEQSADSLLHYHMHANDYSNSEYAGPSDEDLQYASRQGRACIVFTYLDRGTMNADYYQPATGGKPAAVIDLGEINAK
jgi:hypothetical protein